MKIINLLLDEKIKEISNTYSVDEITECLFAEIELSRKTLFILLFLSVGLFLLFRNELFFRFRYIF
jgi:hypothetical protein